MPDLGFPTETGLSWQRGTRVIGSRDKKTPIGRACRCGGQIVRETAKVNTGKTRPMIGGDGRRLDEVSEEVGRLICDTCGALYGR